MSTSQYDPAAGLGTLNDGELWREVDRCARMDLNQKLYAVCRVMYDRGLLDDESDRNGFLRHLAGKAGA